jgi:hypothetical protein
MLMCTAKGNLPRAFCREVAQTFLGEEGYRFLGLASVETDSKDLLAGNYRVRKKPLLDQVVEFRL